jgi:hypothetical protein
VSARPFLAAIVALLGYPILAGCSTQDSGASCDGNAGCGANQWCAFESGCEPTKHGTCQERPSSGAPFSSDPCGRIVAVCTCEGSTDYFARTCGTLPSRKFQYFGACKGPFPADAPFETPDAAMDGPNDSSADTALDSPDG